MASVDAELVPLGIEHDNEVAALVSHPTKDLATQADDSLDLSVNILHRGRATHGRTYVKMDAVLGYLGLGYPLKEQTGSGASRILDSAPVAEPLLWDSEGSQFGAKAFDIWRWIRQDRRPEGRLSFGLSAVERDLNAAWRHVPPG